MARHYPQGARTTMGGKPADAVADAPNKESKMKEQPNGEPSEAQKKLHGKLQADAAKRTLSAQGIDTARSQDAHTDSMLTVGQHVGKREGEPDKPQKDEAKKVDLHAITGNETVETAPVSTEGKGTTDHVVVAPEGARPAATTRPEGYVERVGRAAAKHAKKSAGKTESSASEEDGGDEDGKKGGKRK